MSKRTRQIEFNRNDTKKNQYRNIIFVSDSLQYRQGAKVAKVGTTTTLDAPRDVINLHIRGGHILPAQKPALNTMLRLFDINR